MFYGCAPSRLNGCLGTFGIMRDYFDFYPRSIITQFCNSHTSPDRLMIGHVLLKIANHSGDCFLVDINVIRVDSVDLRPPFATGII